MTESILKYQQTDEKLRAIELELARSDERVKLGQAKKFLDAVPDRLEKLDQRAGELLRMFEAYNKQYSEIVENLKYIETEGENIDTIGYNKKSAEKLQSGIRDLRRQIDALQAEIANITESFSKVRAQTIQMQKQYKDFREKYAELKAEKDSQAKAITKELGEAAKKVDAKLLERYKQKRADKIFPIIYELNGQKCGQCGMELSLSDLNNIKRDKIIECENCRRMIYTKE